MEASSTGENEGPSLCKISSSVESKTDLKTEQNCAFQPEGREQKFDKFHDVGGSSTVSQKRDGCAVSDSGAANLCLGESAAKVSKYDRENQNFELVDRDQTCPLDKVQPVLPSTSKSISTSESQIKITETKGEENSLKNPTRKTGQNQSKAHCDGTNYGIESECSLVLGSVNENKTRMEGDREELDGPKRLVLAGLHACGDLTATLLRVFVNCPAVSALVSVACCYMKLSAYSGEDQERCERGYPMSQFVRNLPAHPLTYEAREMACHFADAYAQRLMDSPPHLKIHSYRAAVQYIVTQTRQDFPHGATRLVVKKGAEMPFPQYAKVCLQRLGIDPAEVADSVMTKAESLTTNWRHVVAFYTLRLSLAPLVETALLLDRMLFLYEHGVHSALLPVFDSALSPRNFALLACKAPSTAEGL